MKRVFSLGVAALLLVSSGCRDLADEVLDEAAEVVRDQKHKVVEGLQDAAINKLDEQRQNAAGALTGESEEEAAEDADSAL